MTEEKSVVRKSKKKNAKRKVEGAAIQPIPDSALDELLAESNDVVEEARTAAAAEDDEIERAYAGVSFRIMYQNNNFFLPQVRDLINGREVLNLRPEYQRRLRWPTKKKSLLIESLLLNIPIPPIFLYESEAARYEVMDGQQRLNAIHEFLEDGFGLTGLEKLDFLNRRTYKQLPPQVRRGLDRASVNAIVLLRETQGDANDPFLVRRYVFERLNTGGEPLNAQEIRNSIYRGKFNEMIVRLARNETFCRVLDIPAYTETDENEYYENPERQKNNLYKKMADCQIVLRFFALRRDDYIRGSMRSILDTCMKRDLDATDADIAIYERSFRRAINACDKIFAGRPFLLPPDETGKQRVSIALYDACMVGLYRKRNQLKEILANRKRFTRKIETLVKRELELFTGKANTAQSVKDRIAAVEEIVDEVV